MRITRNHFLFLGVALAILALYIVLRLLNILNLPLFTDEAIYIRWAQIAKQDASWRFIALVDGKGPSFVWAEMLTLKLFKDPLFAGRMVSVITGIFTTIGLFFLGNEVFREKQKGKEYKVFSFTKETVPYGLLSSLIYVLYPFGLVYDRMALYDSMVGMFAVWSLYLLFLLVRTLRLDVALITGIVAGGGLLTKVNATFSLYSIPFLLLIFDWKQKNVKSRLAKFVGLSLVIVILAYGIYSILRLSPFYHIIGEKTTLFVYPFGEWIHHPFTYFYSNARALLNWFFIYMSVPSIILIIASFFVNKKNFMEKAVLFLWFIFPITALALFGKLIYPRFILFMTLSLIPLISYSIINLVDKYKSPLIRALIILFAFVMYIYADYFIIFNFAYAPIPGADLGQYINGWSAGNGVKQSVAYFNEQAKDKKIYIVTEGTFGLMPYGLEMYLVNNPNIKIQALWPINDNTPKDILDKAKVMPTYAVFYQPCPSCGNEGGKMPPLWKGEKVLSEQQGIGNSFYSVYRILP
ncbi:MAG TPA: glycosyltransferase family 39 protein [Patescibacteria group bacterium]|nr:glycosyltransferase family 39 protein [Patescibacteria group bacterium]